LYNAKREIVAKMKEIYGGNIVDVEVENIYETTDEAML
jgi:hypothetical protein